MKKILILITCSIFANKLIAQKIDGLWYSSDSTRIYEITKTHENSYTAVIKSSTREKDCLGYAVIKDLRYNNHRKRYEGGIYSVEDGKSTFVKIKFSNSNKLTLKLSRMFVFDVSIEWIRASDNLSVFAL